MDRQSGGLCLPKSDSLPFGVAAMALRTAMGTVAAAGGFPLPLLADQEREMKVTMAISTIEIKIVERFAPIQLNMENHSFAFANFGKAQALSVVASL